MEEMQEFTKQYEELAKRVEKIEEAGVVELRRVYDELVSLDTRSGISIENFTNNSDNDLYDRLDALKIWDALKEKIRTKEVEVLSHYRARKDVLDAKFAEYRRVKAYRRENQRRINEFRFELDKHRALLNHISDSFAKDNMEDTIKDDEKHITRSEALNRQYDLQLSELESECKTLLNGGILSELNKSDEEDIIEELELDDNKRVFEKPAAKEEKKEEPKKETKEENTITEEEEEPVIATPRRVTLKREEDRDLNAPSKKAEDNNVKGVVPPKFIDLPLVDTKEPEVKPAALPNNIDVEEPKEDLDEEDVKLNNPLPPKFVDLSSDDSNEPEDIIEQDDPIIESTEQDDPIIESPEEDEEEYEDLDEPVDAQVIKPKQALWKKIGSVIVKAVAFLSVVGTAIHTGISAHRMVHHTSQNTGKEEIVEETEIETETSKKKHSKADVKEKVDEKKEVNETKKVNEKKEVNETKNAETIKEETKKEEPKKTEVKEEPKKEENKETKEEEKKEEPKDEVIEEPMEIKLNPGESVYNTDTGVEVGYDGSSAVMDSDGNVEEQNNRELDYNEDNQAIVTQDDLNVDYTEEVPVTQTTERTGLEVSEEEAKSQMTEEEKAAAENAEEEAFLQMMLEENGLSR